MIVNPAIDVSLLDPLGVVAAAIGTSVAFAIYIGGHIAICHDVIGLQVRPVAVPLVRCAIAAAVMAGVLAAFGNRSLSPFEWVAGLVIGTAAYGAARLVVREVAWTDVLPAGGLVAARLGRA